MPPPTRVLPMLWLKTGHRHKLSSSGFNAKTGPVYTSRIFGTCGASSQSSLTSGRRKAAMAPAGFQPWWGIFNPVDSRWIIEDDYPSFHSIGGQLGWTGNLQYIARSCTRHSGWPSRTRTFMRVRHEVPAFFEQTCIGQQRGASR
jgi:hypothetical protein